MKKIYDITRTIGYDTIDYPGDTKFTLSNTLSISKGDKWNLFKLEMSNHIGTHVDAPLHKFKKGKSINDYPLDVFFLDCILIEIKNKSKISVDDIKRKKIIKKGAVLFKTNNSYLSRKKIYNKFIYLDSEAADFLIEKEVSLVGIDYISIDPFDSECLAHHKLLSNNIIILEDANLKNIKPGFYTLIWFPLKINKSNGAPVRALLIK